MALAASDATPLRLEHIPAMGGSKAFPFETSVLPQPAPHHRAGNITGGTGKQDLRRTIAARHKKQATELGVSLG